MTSRWGNKGTSTCFEQAGYSNWIDINWSYMISGRRPRWQLQPPFLGDTLRILIVVSEINAEANTLMEVYIFSRGKILTGLEQSRDRKKPRRIRCDV